METTQPKNEAKVTRSHQLASTIAHSSRNPDQSEGDLADGNASVRHAILFVDDEKSVLKALKRAFVDEGYRILTAENAQGAFDLLAKNKITLIISDYRMPGMSGTDFLTKVKERYPGTIRIMLTGAADTKTVSEAIDGGVLYKFITKPWNDDGLRLTVKLAIAQYELLQENANLKDLSRQQYHEIHKLRRFASTNCSPLGNILVSKEVILPAQLEMVERYCRQNNTVLYKALTELGMVHERDLIKIIQDESATDVVSLDESLLNRDLSQLLPREVCESGCLVPIRQENTSLRLAMADTLDLPRVDYVSFITGHSISSQLASLSDIEKAIRYIYTEPETEAESAAEEIDPLGEADDIDIMLVEEELDTPEQLMARSIAPSAVKTVNTVIAGAVRTGASDIHIEPKAGHTLVRYRIDGLLRDWMKIPARQHLPTISRIKILAKMDISVRRVPQDGRITVKSGERFLDIRVSTMPTISGEKAVCRLLDKNASVKSIEEIGVAGRSLDRLRSIINVPQGIIIATGPTGSGKTTTLYALLNERMSGALNYVTIEDPVEYFLEEASQVHVHHKIGLTFASSLRATLRQDPDVILVGEVRDTETAQAAFQAAMTGHLVFTSLHTNSTIGAITRLLHLGIEPYLVASAVQGIIAQRLVRRVCPDCKERVAYDSNVAGALGIDDSDFPEKLYYGKGCENCAHTGFKGRMGLYEVFHMNEEFRQCLTTSFHETQLLNMARSLGMKTLLEDGTEKVLRGITTLEEVLRVLGPNVKYDNSCRNCGSDLDLKFSTCPYCGSPHRRICRKCNSRLDFEWVACPYCGQNTGE